MARTHEIEVNGEFYLVGWNEDGWFAVLEDGESTEYCGTIAELRMLVANRQEERAALGELAACDFDPDRDDVPTCQECGKFLEEDHVGNWRCGACHAREVGRNFLNCCGTDDYDEWFQGDESDLEEVVGQELIDLCGDEG